MSIKGPDDMHIFSWLKLPYEKRLADKFTDSAWTTNGNAVYI